MRLLNFVPVDTKIRFIRAVRLFFFLSGILVTASLLLFAGIGLNFGIDFRGGTLIEIQTDGPADIGQIRADLGGLGLGDLEIQEFGAPTDVLIRIEQQPGGEEAQQAAVQSVRNALGPDVEIRRVEVVGPKVSQELTQQGTIAVIAAVLAVLVYIWFRFEWQFALGAVASLVHDVILTIGLFVILQIQFNLAIIAAILTIVGYSLNDTVVVYDRIRENLRKYKQMPLPDLIDRSINDMLSRTIVTSLTTLIALLSLYIFGGEVIRGFTFAMIWGVLIGTYSSVFIAAPLLLVFGLAREQPSAAEAKQKDTDKAAVTTRP